MSSTSYKVPAHIKKYVKVELYNFNKTKKLIETMQNSKLVPTHSLLIAERKVAQIQTVRDRLNKDQRDIAEVIFFKHYSQAKAELEEYISYDSYYWTMNKVIYLVAEEMDLI